MIQQTFQQYALLREDECILKFLHTLAAFAPIDQESFRCQLVVRARPGMGDTGMGNVGCGIGDVGYGIGDMGYGIWDMGYGIWDMGYGIWDMGYGIWDRGCGIWDRGYGIWDMGYGIWDVGYGIWDMGCGIWDMGYGIWDMGYGIWDMGYGIWDMGCGIWDMGYGMWVIGDRECGLWHSQEFSPTPHLGGPSQPQLQQGLPVLGGGAPDGFDIPEFRQAGGLGRGESIRNSIRGRFHPRPRGGSSPFPARNSHLGVLAGHLADALGADDQVHGDVPSLLGAAGAGRGFGIGTIPKGQVLSHPISIKSQCCPHPISSSLHPVPSPSGLDVPRVSHPILSHPMDPIPYHGSHPTPSHGSHPIPSHPIPYPISHIPYPLSHIPYPISHIPYPISPIPYPISHIPYLYRPAHRRGESGNIPHPKSHIPYPISHIPYPTSHIPYPISHIPYPLSHIPYPISHTPYPISHIPYPIPHIPHPISHIPYPISHIPYPLSHIPYLGCRPGCVGILGRVILENGDGGSGITGGSRSHPCPSRHSQSLSVKTSSLAEAENMADLIDGYCRLQGGSEGSLIAFPRKDREKRISLPQIPALNLGEKHSTLSHSVSGDSEIYAEILDESSRPRSGIQHFGISRDAVELGQILGEGFFGEVYEGTYTTPVRYHRPSPPPS
uniref:FAK1-like FERM domain-containing protein n=1 Tax=Serinus canaria TaxID=9135 RepID=A0A8C9KQY4_SERCA